MGKGDFKETWSSSHYGSDTEALAAAEEHIEQLQAVMEAYEQKFLHKRSDLRDARYRNTRLKAENDELRHILYIEGWSDAGIGRAIKEVE